MKAKRQEMYEQGMGEVTLDMAHFFLLYQMVCHMKQIRQIVRQEDDSLSGRIAEGVKT